MNDRLKFLLEELVENREIIILALDGAATSDSNITRAQSDEMEKLIDELSPYVDPVNYQHRTGSLLHFPLMKYGEDMIKVILDTMKIEVSVEHGKTLNINIPPMHPNIMSNLTKDEVNTIESIVKGKVHSFIKRLEYSGVLRNPDILINKYIYRNDPGAFNEWVDKNNKEIIDKIDINILKESIKKELLTPYIPYKGFKEEGV